MPIYRFRAATLTDVSLLIPWLAGNLARIEISQKGTIPDVFCELETGLAVYELGEVMDLLPSGDSMLVSLREVKDHGI